MRKAVLLALADLVMPRISGTECIAGLLKIDPRLKIVVTLGNPAGEETARLLSQGAIAFVQNPYDAQQLSRAVHDAMAGSQT